MMRLAPLLRSAVALCLALLVAGASVEASRHRASQPGEAALAAYVASGGDLADLCRPDGANGAHVARPCPFCHGLPKAPVLTAPDLARRLSLTPLWPQALADLGLTPQAGNPHVCARAPPALA